ncbi:MAG TPA: heme transporter, partial [Polyangiaceae bacterium]|nr:heme transporter [Polyangiaceae bacterium]
VLAVVLFPLLSPTLLTAVVATRELLGGTPLRELGDYLRILGVFDFAFAAAGLGLFGTLMDA